MYAIMHPTTCHWPGSCYFEIIAHLGQKNAHTWPKPFILDRTSLMRNWAKAKINFALQLTAIWEILLPITSNKWQTCYISFRRKHCHRHIGPKGWMFSPKQLHWRYHKLTHISWPKHQLLSAKKETKLSLQIYPQAWRGYYFFLTIKNHSSTPKICFAFGLDCHLFSCHLRWLWNLSYFCKC